MSQRTLFGIEVEPLKGKSAKRAAKAGAAPPKAEPEPPPANTEQGPPPPADAWDAAEMLAAIEELEDELEAAERRVEELEAILADKADPESGLRPCLQLERERLRSNDVGARFQGQGRGGRGEDRRDREPPREPTGPAMERVGQNYASYGGRTNGSVSANGNGHGGGRHDRTGPANEDRGPV